MDEQSFYLDTYMLMFLVILKQRQPLSSRNEERRNVATNGQDPFVIPVRVVFHVVSMITHNPHHVFVNGTAAVRPSMSFALSRLSQRIGRGGLSTRSWLSPPTVL